MGLDTEQRSPFVPAAHGQQRVTGTGRSMFGHQTQSQKCTSPQYTFGKTTDRDQASKTFLSSAHLDVSVVQAHECAS